MKIAEINSVCYGSTGKIMMGIAKKAEECGHQTLCCYAPSKNNFDIENNYIIGKSRNFPIYYHLVQRVGYDGRFGYFATKKLIKKLKEFKPDIIHLHNLHGFYLNIKLLLNYIKKSNIPVVYTLHDCWSFTGGCAHYDFEGCTKWVDGNCKGCTRKKEYPMGKHDNTYKNYLIKKKLFSGVKNLTVVTPSEWLKSQVKKSYLGGRKIKVINNGIDLNIFKNTPSDFKKEYGIEDKVMLLGVASNWTYKKGIDIFNALAERLDKNKYQIVLVGTNEQVDKCINSNIISIHRTQNQVELAKIYSAADIFINPTREDTYPTVNLEAVACKTPVITFDVGGTKETVNEKSGIILKDKDCGGVIKAIEEILQNKDKYDFRSVDFDENKKYGEYINLFNEIIK